MMTAVDMDRRMGPAAYARHLSERYGIKMSRQAVAKNPTLPRAADGRIIVDRADAVLAERGRITHDAPDIPTLPLEQPAAEEADRPASFYEEKAQTERVTRAIQEIKLAQLRGELVEVSAVTEAMVTAGRRIGEAIGAIHTRAAGIEAAALAEGAHGVRRELMALAHELRTTLAHAMRLDAADDDDEAEEDA